MVDSLLFVKQNSKLNIDSILKIGNKRIILLTVHRRENWGNNLAEISKGIIKILKNNQDVICLLPLHKNKLVRDPLQQYLGSQERIIFKEPLNYEELVSVLSNSSIILTDSGGIQEEAPSFGKPVLVLRNSTERIEAIDSGVAKLVGIDSEIIFEEANNLLNDLNYYNSMSQKVNPFGDGKASERIFKICMNFL